MCVSCALFFFVRKKVQPIFPLASSMPFFYNSPIQSYKLYIQFFSVAQFSRFSQSSQSFQFLKNISIGSIYFSQFLICKSPILLATWNLQLKAFSLSSVFSASQLSMNSFTRRKKF